MERILYTWYSHVSNLASPVRLPIRGMWTCCSSYLLLCRVYETPMQQVLQQRALEIVASDSSYDSQWKRAAEQLRAPYWDWASREGNGVPPEEVIAQRDITIRTPQGTKTMKNPLLSYTFHPKIDPSFRPPFSQWIETLRHPKPRDAPNAQTNVDELVKCVSYICSIMFNWCSRPCL